MKSQIEKYDEGLMNWMEAKFRPVIPDKDIQLLFAPPDRPYSEYVSGRYDKVKTLRIPRMSLSRSGLSFAQNRYNHSKIRYLGYTSTSKLRMKQSPYPIPVDIPYQMDFWVGYESEIQALQIEFLRQMVSGIVYPTVYINDTFLTKYLPVYLDGAIVNSETELGSEFRHVRATLPLKAEAWIYADNIDETTTIRDIILRVRDMDTGVVL